MDTASNLLFILFALVVAYNLCAWLMQKHILPLIGFILFALACILRAEAAPALWLFLFADAGTWLLCLLLIPASIQDLREKTVLRFTPSIKTTNKYSNFIAAKAGRFLNGNTPPTSKKPHILCLADLQAIGQSAHIKFNS